MRLIGDACAGNSGPSPFPHEAAHSETARVFSLIIAPRRAHLQLLGRFLSAQGVDAFLSCGRGAIVSAGGCGGPHTAQLVQFIQQFPGNYVQGSSCLHGRAASVRHGLA